METNQIFIKLKSILENYQSELIAVENDTDKYYLNTSKSDKNKKPEFFGSVQIKKSYVAFHLMPIYYYPELLDEISDELKKRMQGKSCFNFTKVNDRFFTELEELTKKAFNQYKLLERA